MFLVEINSWLSRIGAKEAEEAKKRELGEAKARERQQAFASGMVSWSEEFGSPRLKAAIGRGYKANTTYAVERAARELPGFWVDTAGDAKWGERSDPTAEALQLEAGVRARLANESLLDLDPRIVWLDEAPRALNRWVDWADFEPQEAILIERYLGRYPIVMTVDPEFHRDPELEA